jgi:hypothetical protein
MGQPYEHLVRVIQIRKEKKRKKNGKDINPLGQPYEHLVRVIKIN